MKAKIEQLKNLGPQSAKMLALVGIDELEQLRCIGSVGAYLEVKLSGQKASLNLLYAIHAGLQGRHWTSLSASEKESLQIELDEQASIRQLLG